MVEWQDLKMNPTDRVELPDVSIDPVHVRTGRLTDCATDLMRTHV
jgi:hypothetical protein